MAQRFVFECIERRFQLWAYEVGMRRLLLRSTKSDTFASRIDVYFQNVKALKLPTSLDGLMVTEADDKLAMIVEFETGILVSEETRIFSVRCGPFDGYIVAGVCVVMEDEGEYFEPSQVWREP